MFIWGTNKALAGTLQSITICPNCGSQGTVLFNIFRKHLHFFWIPMFPYGKTSEFHCTSCRRTMEFKEMPMNMRDEAKQSEKEVGGPIWQFAGLMILPFLIALFIYMGKKMDAEEMTYILKPMKGDVYSFHIKRQGYSTMKVFKVSSDSIWVQYNTLSTNKLRKVYRIDKAANYEDTLYLLKHEDILNMYEKREIYDVDRHKK